MVEYAAPDQLLYFMSPSKPFMGEPMFAFRQLRAFVAVAECGSFTRAAEQLHLSQPALSASIRKLESLLGLSLFARDTRCVTLTLAGRHFLDHARHILEGMEQALADARDMAHLRRGLVRVAALPSIASSHLPRIARVFSSRHPEIDLDIRDGLAGSIQRGVAAGEVDIALSSRPRDDQTLGFTRLWQDQLIAVTPTAGVARARDWRQAVRKRPYIALTADTSIRPLADRALSDAGIAATPAWEVSRMSSAIAMVREQLGYTLLPACCIEVFNLGAEISNWRIDGAARDLGLLWRRPLQQSPALDAFMALLREHTPACGEALERPVI